MISAGQESNDVKKMIIDFPIDRLEELSQPVDEREYKLLLKDNSSESWVLVIDTKKQEEISIQNRRSPDSQVKFHRYKINEGKWLFGVNQGDAQNQKTDLWIYNSRNGWQQYPTPEWKIKDFVSESIVLPVELNVAVRPYLSVELGDILQFKINTYTFSQEAANHFEVNSADFEHNYIKYKYVLRSGSLAMEKKQDEDFEPLLSVFAKVESEQTDNLIEDEFHCAQGVTVVSSSELTSEGKFSYNVNNLLDENETSAWSEGVKGNGIGEWIEFTISAQFLIGESYHINNGYSKDKNSWRNNGRVKKMKCLVDGKPVAYITLQDDMTAQSFTISPPWYNQSFQLQKGDKIRFVIEEVYKGLKYEDTLITQFIPIGNCN